MHEHRISIAFGGLRDSRPCTGAAPEEPAVAATAERAPFVDHLDRDADVDVDAAIPTQRAFACHAGFVSLKLGPTQVQASSGRRTDDDACSDGASSGGVYSGVDCDDDPSFSL